MSNITTLECQKKRKYQKNCNPDYRILVSGLQNTGIGQIVKSADVEALKPILLEIYSYCSYRKRKARYKQLISPPANAS